MQDKVRSKIKKGTLCTFDSIAWLIKASSYCTDSRQDDMMIILSDKIIPHHQFGNPRIKAYNTRKSRIVLVDPEWLEIVSDENCQQKCNSTNSLV